MAEIAKSADASVDTVTGMVAPMVAGDLRAGENIAACDLCYIASTGLVMRALGAATGVTVRAPRVSPTAAVTGAVVTLLGLGTRYRYTNGTPALTPGALYFISGTVAGALADAASTGDTTGTVQAVSDTDVVIVRSL